MNTVPKLMFFNFASPFYGCSGGSYRSQKTMETKHETGAESDRLASTFLGSFCVVFFVGFCWSALKDNGNPKRRRLFLLLCVACFCRLFVAIARRASKKKKEEEEEEGEEIVSV